MCTVLTVAGAAFEVVGLGLVFIELAVIRSHELGVPTPWAQLGAWARRLLRRPQIIEGGAAVEATAALSGRAKVRPGDLPADATDAARIARLERYIEHLDRDIDTLHKTIDRKADEVIAEAKSADDRLREEMERRDEQRRTALRPSLQRQAFGAACVLTGLVLGTIGQVG